MNSSCDLLICRETVCWLLILNNLDSSLEIGYKESRTALIKPTFQLHRILVPQILCC